MSWESDDSWGQPSRSWRFDDVAFSGDTLVAAYQSGFVLRIVDWARNVQRVDVPINSMHAKLRCLAFPGGGPRGYLGVLRTHASATDARLFVTNDGGRTWVPSDPGDGLGPWHGLCGLSAIRSTVWAVGTYHGAGSRLGHLHVAAAIVSRDGGVTWTSNFTGANSLIDVHFPTEDDGLIAGQDAGGFPGVWTTKNGGNAWLQVALPDAALQGARCWKIGRDEAGFRVAITVDSPTPQTRLLLTEDFRDPANWRSVVVDLTAATQDTKLAGIGWLGGKHWVGVNLEPSHESADLTSWSQTSLPNGGGPLYNVNRIIRGPRGGLYAAGESLYRYY